MLCHRIPQHWLQWLRRPGGKKSNILCNHPDHFLPSRAIRLGSQENRTKQNTQKKTTSFPLRTVIKHQMSRRETLNQSSCVDKAASSLFRLQVPVPFSLTAVASPAPALDGWGWSQGCCSLPLWAGSLPSPALQASGKFCSVLFSSNVIPSMLLLFLDPLFPLCWRWGRLTFMCLLCIHHVLHTVS